MLEGLVKHGLGIALSILVGYGIWLGLEHDFLEKEKAESGLIAIFIGGLVELIYLLITENFEFKNRFKELFELHNDACRKHDNLIHDVGSYLQKQEKLGFLLKSPWIFFDKRRDGKNMDKFTHRDASILLCYKLHKSR